MAIEDLVPIFRTAKLLLSQVKGKRNRKFFVNRFKIRAPVPEYPGPGRDLTFPCPANLTLSAENQRLVGTLDALW